jgi:RNA polymerase sigma-70 factor (ECF subfamily)
MEMDGTLLEAARKMDQGALIRIFDLYATPLYNYAMRLCGDRLLADQIVGDVFAKLLDQFSSGRGPTTNLRSYLYEMVHHRMVDEARYAGRRAPLEVLTSSHDGHSTLTAAEDKILLEQILRAIQQDLTDDQRHVIVLRFLEGFNLQETAAIVGKRAGHVRVIQTRALEKLRQTLKSRKARVVRRSVYPPLRESQITKSPSM